MEIDMKLNNEGTELKMAFTSLDRPINKFLEKLAIKYSLEIENIYYEVKYDFCNKFVCDEYGRSKEIEKYKYFEGMYKLLNKEFWESEMPDIVDNMIRDELLIEPGLEMFPYFNEEDKIRYKQMYEEAVENM